MFNISLLSFMKNENGHVCLDMFTLRECSTMEMFVHQSAMVKHLADAVRSQLPTEQDPFLKLVCEPHVRIMLK